MDLQKMYDTVFQKAQRFGEKSPSQLSCDEVLELIRMAQAKSPSRLTALEAVEEAARNTITVFETGGWVEPVGNELKIFELKAALSAYDALKAGEK
jgi:hypothetical protein